MALYSVVVDEGAVVSGEAETALHATPIEHNAIARYVDAVNPTYLRAQLLEYDQDPERMLVMADYGGAGVEVKLGLVKPVAVDVDDGIDTRVLVWKNATAKLYGRGRFTLGFNFDRRTWVYRAGFVSAAGSTLQAELAKWYYPAPTAYMYGDSSGLRILSDTAPSHPSGWVANKYHSTPYVDGVIHPVTGFYGDGGTYGPSRTYSIRPTNAPSSGNTDRRRCHWAATTRQLYRPPTAVVTGTDLYSSKRVGIQWPAHYGLPDNVTAAYRASALDDRRYWKLRLQQWDFTGNLLSETDSSAQIIPRQTNDLGDDVDVLETTVAAHGSLSDDACWYRYQLVVTVTLSGAEGVNTREGSVWHKTPCAANPYATPATPLQQAGAIYWPGWLLPMESI
jgi:hypothetical protein